MKRQARMNYRTSKDAAQAAQLAYDQISRQWSTVRGTMVHKASERLPDNADDMVNAMLRAKLPQIQREMGEDITLDDLAIDDARHNAKQTDPLLMSVHLGNEGVAITLGDDNPAPLVFTMEEAKDALRAESLREANAERPTADDVEAAKPAPPPAPGSPGAMADASADDRRATRDAIGQAVGSAASSTWQSVRDHLAEARERQQERQTQGAPGKAY
ncbi:MAG: hypothetical protein CMP08_09300 [Xanthomonadales bacterium]|nr:hypothetical protein [Xanthomonadales bacterium]